MLLASAASRGDGDGLWRVHDKLLANYLAWTRQLGVDSQCARPSDPPASRATDVVLLLLVWGEAANLRHAPECLCFIWHEMRREVRVAPAAPVRPPGWFLAHVVAPLYRR
jgi:callose synthase